MATIRDVAKLAGVSSATVSRVLNNSGYISESARKNVQAAVKELNYYPNEVARSLFQKQSNFIGLLLPDITNPFFPAIAKGVEDQINERGYSLLLGNVEDDSEKEQDYLKIFAQNNVAGVISAMQGHDKELPNIPVVVLDRVDDEQHYSVHADDYIGGQLAAEAIAARNPENLVIMSGPKDVHGANARLAGSQKILDNQQIPYTIFQTDSYRMDYAEETAEQFFKHHADADSVIASNDVYALALMKEAIKRGRKIPKDFQIIGYDDIPFSRMMYPGLATIAQPAYEIGYQGAKLLCDIIEKKEVENSQLQLAVELIVRDSLRKKDEDEQ